MLICVCHNTLNTFHCILKDSVWAEITNLLLARPYTLKDIQGSVAYTVKSSQVKLYWSKMEITVGKLNKKNVIKEV